MSLSKVKSLLIAAMVLISVCSSGQSANVRGLYLNGIDTWLGDSTIENQVLSYSLANNFNYLTFYDLDFTGWNQAEEDLLASFIKKARSHYGIDQVGAAGETSYFFSHKVIPYNNSRSNPAERFDVLNFEFEFWILHSINSFYSTCYLIPNGYSTDTAGAFAFSWKEFQKIDSISDANGLMSEIYLGWPTQGQMQQIASIADRILLHAYRPTDADVYQYSDTRLEYIASANKHIDVMPIFSSEPDYMQDWLDTFPVEQPYQTYNSYYTADTGVISQYINLEGYQWFKYSTMPNPFSNTASITANGPISFCQGGSVTLKASQGTSYLWSPGGETTRSISVSSAGSYSVAVTHTSGGVAVSAPVIVAVGSGASPSISPNTPTSLCSGNNLVLTSSLAGSYLWSNGATTRSITVSTSGSYTVSTTSTGCTSTSAPRNVNVILPPSVPTIIANGPLSFCHGENVTLTSSSANGYLWSNGATTRSIVVNTDDDYSVRVYSGPSCSETSDPVTVNTLSLPATPLISPDSTITLSPTQPSVQLTSTTANAYTWSNGQTSQQINVVIPGSYSVTVTGTNGCTSTSSSVMITVDSCSTPVPVITVTGTINSGQGVTLTSSPANGYLWSNGATTNSITVYTTGIYFVRTYSSLNCYSTSALNIIKGLSARLSGTNEPSQAVTNLVVYPNPANDNATISYSSEITENSILKIVDPAGKEIMSKEIQSEEGENKIFIDVSTLSSGAYYIFLINSQEKISGKLIVK